MYPHSTPSLAYLQNGRTELITAIGDLWLLALVVLLGLAMFLFRAEFRGLLSKLKNVSFKRGATSVSIDTVKEKELESLPVRPTAETSTPASKLSPEAVEPRKEETEEQPTTFDDWHRVMVVSLLATNKDFTKASRALEELLKLAPNDSAKLEAKADYYFFLFFAGKASALDELKKLAESSSVSYAWGLLGTSYARSDLRDEAAYAFKRSLEASESDPPTRRASNLAKYSLALMKAGNTDQAHGLLRDALGVPDQDPDILRNLYVGLAKLYEQGGQQDWRAIALEKALELDPNDTESRFNAGWAYSDSDAGSALALLHYKTLQRLDPQHYNGANNLGVEYDRLELPIRSIASFRAAAPGNTLAMANLAYKFLNKGFKDEASKILDEAQKRDLVHENVAQARVDIAEKISDESSQEETLINDARQRQQFLRKFAQAYLVTTTMVPDFSGVWLRSDGYVMNIVNTTSSSIEAEWEGANRKNKMVGVTLNRGFTVVETRTANTILGGSSELNGYAYFSADGDTIYVMFDAKPSAEYILLNRT